MNGFNEAAAVRCGIPESGGDPGAAPEASMRPQLFAAEYDMIVKVAGIRGQRFNEAAAVRCGIPDSEGWTEEVMKQLQ